MSTSEQTYHSSEFESRVKKAIARLYETESNLTRHRHELVSKLSAIDEQINAVTKRRDELNAQFKKVDTDKATEADKTKLNNMLHEVAAEQKKVMDSASDQLSGITRSLAEWADQAAEAGKSTWENIRGSVNIPNIGGSSDSKDAYLKEVNQAINDLGHRISMLEDDLSAAQQEAKADIKKQIKTLQGHQEKLKGEAEKLRASTEATWEKTKVEAEKMVNQAQDALKK